MLERTESATSRAMSFHDAHSDPAEYDQYTQCLAKALCYVATPITVGLYAPWGSGVDHLQYKIERCLVANAATIEEKEWARLAERPRSAEGPLGVLALVARLLFYDPVLTRRQRDRRNVRFVFVPFNAWEFAGSDRLWAGLVTALCEAVRLNFRTLPTAIYRAVRSRAVPTRQHCGGGDTDWEVKRLLGVPLWFVPIIFLALLVLLLVIVLVLGFPNGQVVAIEGVCAGLLGVSSTVALRNVLAIVRSAVVTQKAEVEKIMNRTDFSDQLGFMCKVKQEVQVVTNLVRYMEVFERRRIRIVLKVCDLDRCAPDKIVSVLEAMSILLSDKHARFVSLLGVDPRVVAEAVERVYANLGKASDNSYLLLNRTVDLPFTVPQMDKRVKLGFLNAFAEGMDWAVNDDAAAGLRSVAFGERRSRRGPDDDAAAAAAAVPLAPCARGTAASPFVLAALQFLKSGDGTVLDYVEHNLVTMRRIVNTLPVIVRLAVAAHGGLGPTLTPERMVAWTVLSTQWPCRLSWTLQCGAAWADEPGVGEDASMWDVYERSLTEFRALMKDLDDFFVLDGDSAQFQRFLKRDHVFTVREGAMLRPLSVNLDRSIQSQMELLRGKYSIRNFDRKRGGHGKAFDATKLPDMTPEDVCREMEALELSSERLAGYQSRAVEHGVSGRALLHGTEEEVRRALGMQALGDWATFRDHFLGTSRMSRAARDKVDGGDDEMGGELDEQEDDEEEEMRACGNHRRRRRRTDASRRRV
uniref:NTPase KAP family P-loop domain-containing protein 1-like n=1 Tax=Petromyzon marinus TaxID=7757 RepID=A0AAJ7X476_PETMA|nr:NTPase KAP family P-loop domain-containing protein 1-like [Petromyzon marinus]XP_032820910.1 NTPase KAP family P-loop domain-containing protein 1-like [Petromyzon marinus]